MKIVIFLLLWILAGNIAYLIDFYRPKFQDEPTINYPRALMGGIALLVMMLIFEWFSSDANNKEEDDLY